MTEAGKIRIWATVVESYRFVFTHPRDLLRVGWLPLIALFALNLFFDASGFAPTEFDPSTIGPALGKAAINIMALSLIAATILVAWHRVVLLGATGRRGSLDVTLGWRELRYLLSWLVLSGAFLVLFIIAWFLVLAGAFVFMAAVNLALKLSITGDIVDLGQSEQFLVLEYAAILPAFLLASYFATRLSLVLPAMATDKRRSLGRAWSLSAGNGWRLVLASLIVILPAELVSAGIGLAARGVLGTPLYYPLAFAASCALFLLIVATGTVLSLFSAELDEGATAPSAFGIAALVAE